jgi:hypothetical protein
MKERWLHTAVSTWPQHFLLTASQIPQEGLLTMSLPTVCLRFLKSESTLTELWANPMVCASCTAPMTSCLFSPPRWQL